VRVGVLNNLRAGKKDSRVAQVLEVLDHHPEVLHIETSSGALVPEAMATFAAEGVELLVLNGGDGTVQRVLTALLPARDWMPLLAPIRGGRTNMTAQDLGAHRSAEKGLAGLLEAVRRGTVSERIVERNVLRADLGAGEGVKYGMFFGAGMLHRAIELSHRVFAPGRQQGTFGAGLVTALLIARAAMGKMRGVLEPDKVEIALDGKPAVPDSYVLLMATTLDRLFLRMRPFWGQGPGPLRVTAIAAHAAGLPRAVPGILRGKPGPRVTPEAGYTSLNVLEAAFSLNCGVFVDGELHAGEPGRFVHLSAEDRVRFVRA
jgi:diacylglycerol kinase family enzyme